MLSDTDDSERPGRYAVTKGGGRMSVVIARQGTSPPDNRVQVQDEPSWTTDILDYAALGLVAILALVTVARGPVPVREILVLGFLCYVPGRAFATHWTWLQGAPLALVTVVGGLAVTTLLATTSLASWWSPTLLFWAEAAAGCASIVGADQAPKAARADPPPRRRSPRCCRPRALGSGRSGECLARPARSGVPWVACEQCLGEFTRGCGGQWSPTSCWF